MANNVDHSTRRENPNSVVGTVHSNQENSDEGIPIIHAYPPKRLRRVVFEMAPFKRALNDNGVWHFYIPPGDEEKTIKEFMIEYLPKEKYAFIIPDDELYYKVSETYRKYFDSSAFKPVRYTKVLTEIDEREEQLRLIQEYHLKNDRHAGIESFL